MNQQLIPHYSVVFQTKLQTEVDSLNGNVNALTGGLEELKNQMTDKIKEEKEVVRNLRQLFSSLNAQTDLTFDMGYIWKYNSRAA